MDSLVRGLRSCEPKGLCEVQYLEALTKAGPDGRTAVLAYAQHAPWEQVREVVQLMAAVPDPRALPFLITSLDSSDWRVVIAAEYALAAKGGAARSALPRLAVVEREHWMPRARSCAAYSRARIEGKSLPEHPVPAYRCDGKRILALDRQCGDHVREGEWTWETEVETAPPPGIDADKTQGARFVSHRVAGGILVGIDRQGWGELLWLRGNRRQTILAEADIFAIVPSAGQLLVIQRTGSGGTVHALTRTRRGSWTATPLIELPGSPKAFQVPSEGGIAVTTEEGTLVVDGRGKVIRYQCPVPPAVETAPPPTWWPKRK